MQNNCRKVRLQQLVGCAKEDKKIGGEEMLTKKQLIDAARCHYTPKCHKECSFYYKMEIADDCVINDCTLKIAELAQTALAYRAMLERLEWRSFAGEHGFVDNCPICGGSKPDGIFGGHWPDCELAALLKESEDLK